MTAEQFIKEYTNNCSNELCAVEDRYGKKVLSYREWLAPEQALRAVEIAKDAFIEKAEDWVKNRAELFVIQTQLTMYYDYKRAVEDFKKYMKGE